MYDFRRFIKRFKKEDVSSYRKKMFVHIPKTAGTSFRESLDDVCTDYGRNSGYNSNLISKGIYDGNDFYTTSNLFFQSDFDWLCGHFPINKYLNWFDIRDVVTFIRDPVQQIISHYNHFSTYYGYEDDFSTFCNKPGMLNIHSQYLGGIPVELIGFVGMTEEYEQSIKLLNAQHYKDYTEKEKNINKYKKVLSKELSEKELLDLRSSLSKDFQLYERVKYLLSERSAFEGDISYWCYSYINLNKNLVLTGCAYYLGVDEAVDLKVLFNGVEIKEFSVSGFYDKYPKVNFPRKRYVGFRVALKGLVNNGDNVEVFVKRTGQKIKVHI